MKVAPMGQVRNNFAKYLAECEIEPVFVTRHGKIAAVLEPMEDSEVEDFLLARSPRFRRMLDRAKKEKGGLPLKEYRKRRGI